MIDTEIRTLDNGNISYPALSVSPIGLTAYRISVNANGDSPLKNLGIRPPIQHQEKGFISKKGQKSIRNAVYWFLYSIDKNLIIHGNGKKKVGFLTLTLPSVQKHSDKEIKAKCLNQFLTEIRNEYSVTKYIWKAEKQDNGGLHFHILTDTFLPVIEMRNKWNRIINKLGYVYEYSQKMKQVSWDQYREIRLKEFAKTPSPGEKQKIRKAFRKGTAEKWRNPNSIDIESLKKVKNVGAYIGKYMSKEHKGNESNIDNLKVDGRLWYSSESISKMKNLQIEGFEPEFPEFIDMLSEAKNEKQIYETDYTTTLSIPIDKLYNQGFKEIPKRFFEYAKDVFNGSKNSDFETEITGNAPIQQSEKKEIENIVKPEQMKIDIFSKMQARKLPIDFD